jgi:hypothetical protein
VALYLLAVPSRVYKWSINPIIIPNPVYSHTRDNTLCRKAACCSVVTVNWTLHCVQHADTCAVFVCAPRKNNCNNAEGSTADTSRALLMSGILSTCSNLKREGVWQEMKIEYKLKNVNLSLCLIN